MPNDYIAFFSMDTVFLHFLARLFSDDVAVQLSQRNSLCFKFSLDPKF